MASPFTSVTCAIRYDNARVVSWSMKSGTMLPVGFSLSIENAREGGTWETLATGLENSCSYVDTRRRNYNKKMDECYRLRLTAGDEEYVSPIVNAGKFNAYPFSAEAENVIRQAEKAIEISGCTGVLVKKKHWGTRCPDCTDFDGQQTVNEHCQRCLGTGYDGGYYQGLTMPIIKDSIKTTEEQGNDCIEAGETVTARCIAYPWVRYGDVWCEDGTNKRYMIGQVVPTASYKQTPLVYTIVMHRIEYTDVLHSVVADERVRVKDIMDSATVDYTYDLQQELEEEALEKSGWDTELDEL